MSAWSARSTLGTPDLRYFFIVNTKPLLIFSNFMIWKK